MSEIASAEAVCPNCGKLFAKRRSDQKFCSAKCRKNLHQKNDRSENPKNSRFSPEKSRTNLELIGTSLVLTELLYTRAPFERFGLMKEIIDCAREGNSYLRSVLTNKFLMAPPIGEEWMYFRHDSSRYLTLPQAAEQYCRYFWGHSVSDVVYCRVQEPPTGEVMSEENVVTICNRETTCNNQLTDDGVGTIVGNIIALKLRYFVGEEAPQIAA